MEHKDSIFSAFFRQAIHHKPEIVRGFKILYYVIGVMLVIFAYMTSQNMSRSLVYEIGTLSGTIAGWMFCISILPGILRRFGMRGMFVSFLMSIRREVGVSMFVLSFLHYSAIRLFPILFGGAALVIPPPLFELLGVAALYSLAPIFITSNNWSVRTMGPWWRRLHAMVYFIVWLLFAHVALQEFEGLAIVLGIFALLEAGSLFYAAGQGKALKSSETQAS